MLQFSKENCFDLMATDGKQCAMNHMAALLVYLTLCELWLVQGVCMYYSVGNSANYPAWFDHLEGSFSYKKVHLKKFLPACEVYQWPSC